MAVCSLIGKRDLYSITSQIIGGQGENCQIKIPAHFPAIQYIMARNLIMGGAHAFFLSCEGELDGYSQFAAWSGLICAMHRLSNQSRCGHSTFTH